MSAAVFDLRLAAVHGPLVITPCSDDLDVGSQGLDAELKADLVITLSCSSVANGGSALFSGYLHQTLSYTGTGHGCAQQILMLIYSTCLYAGNDVLVTEFVGDIFDIKLGSAAALCTLLQALQFFPLSAVYADTDDFVIEVLLQPGDDGSRVQTAGICQNYFSFAMIISSRMCSKIRCGFTVQYLKWKCNT